jgi:hypothetical protein
MVMGIFFGGVIGTTFTGKLGQNYKGIGLVIFATHKGGVVIIHPYTKFFLIAHIE